MKKPRNLTFLFPLPLIDTASLPQDVSINESGVVYSESKTLSGASLYVYPIAEAQCKVVAIEVTWCNGEIEEYDYFEDGHVAESIMQTLGTS